MIAGQALAIRNAATPARTMRISSPAPDAKAEKMRSPARMLAPPTGDGPGVSVLRLKRVSSGPARRVRETTRVPGRACAGVDVITRRHRPRSPAGSSWVRSLSEIGAEPAAFAAASWPSGLTMYCMRPPTTLPWFASSYLVQAIWYETRITG